MTNASVLVALAMIGGVPKKSRAGNVTRVPPPATALIAPPADAAIINPRNSLRDMPFVQDIVANETDSSATSEPACWQPQICETSCPEACADCGGMNEELRRRSNRL